MYSTAYYYYYYHYYYGLLLIALQPEAELFLKYMSYAKRDMHYDKFVNLKCNIKSDTLSPRLILVLRVRDV